MSAIVLLDTSVYLNVLNVPGFNQDRQTVFDDFDKAIKQNDHFLLPLATVWETGNHIAICPMVSNGAPLHRGWWTMCCEPFKGKHPTAPPTFPKETSSRHG